MAARAPLDPRVSRRRYLLAAAIFAGLLFAEVPGSDLLEPDEARYAEIPREMLATGDWLVPRLNGVDYFEKPPLLYWANAAAIRLLGATPYAARLPSRLAALGTAALVAGALVPLFGGEACALAALVCLSSLLFFGLGRTNLTDGLLTFAMTLCIAALARFLEARDRGVPAHGWAALAGLGAGLAVLTKGLVGVVLPGGAFVLWAILRRRPRRIREILLSPAAPVALAVTVPYFLAVERAAPGFSRFLWVHEHFQRYATAEASRPGPPYYFIVLFLAGFLPWTVLLPAAASGAARGEGFAREIATFLLLYAAVVLVFFSLSHSKLPPYILPMWPAAALLVGWGLANFAGRLTAPLAMLALILAAACAAGLSIGLRNGDLPRYGLTGLAIAAAAVVVASAGLAAVLARRGSAPAILALSTGWAIFAAILVWNLPRISPDQSAESLARAAGSAAGSEAEVVCYHTYLQGFPWTLRRRVPIYGWKGELEFGSSRGDQSAWFLPREQFLRDWDSGRKMVVLLRKRDRRDLETHRASLVAENRKYLVAKNF
jgi:4-amino-4-deoxy-L-arabinose transferase-like glycosyltransferase